MSMELDKLAELNRVFYLFWRECKFDVKVHVSISKTSFLLDTEAGFVINSWKRGKVRERERNKFDLLVLY